MCAFFKSATGFVLFLGGMALIDCAMADNIKTPAVIQERFADNSGFGKLNINPMDWKVTNGELRNTPGPGVNDFTFGDADWNDYEIEFKVRRLKIRQQDQHFGIVVRTSPTASVRLYCRGDSIIYMAGSRHDTLGLLAQPLMTGQDAPWTAFRILVKGSQIKVYVDHILLPILDDVMPAAGQINIYAFGLEIALTDLNVKVTRTGEKNTTSDAMSKNILHNSSFEQCTLDGLPDFWGCPHWGLADAYWAVHFEEWQTHFITDTTTAYDGKRSMKIINPNDLPSSGLTLWSVCVGAKQNEKYTFSAYMKSKPSGLKVKLDKETVTLTDQWQRYSTTFVNDNIRGPYSDMLNIIPQTKGAFWIDAVQLENGPLTAYQQLKNERKQLEIQEGNVNKTLTEVPQYHSPYYAHHINLTGKLDDKIWTQVPAMNFVTLSGDVVKEPTEAKVWYNDKGIYIGVKCFDRNAGKNQCAVTARDGNIWNDPSLELFVDTKLSRNYYYHLAVNQRGVQFDGFCNDMSWNGDWKAVTYTDPAGRYWSAEIFLPFGELGIDRGAGDWWGFNIVRNNYSQPEVSCWSPTYGSPHTPTRFGQTYIGRKVQENYYVGCSEAKFKSASDNKSSLVVKLYNNSGMDQDYTISARLTDQKNQTVADFSQTVKLKKDKEQAVELGKVVCLAGTKYKLRFNLYSRDRQDLCFSGSHDLEIPEQFIIQPRYDLYTSENSMPVKIWLNLAQEWLANAKLNLKIFDAAGKEVLSQAQGKLQQEMEVPINIAELKNGDYQLKVELKTATLTAVATRAFLKRPAVAYETKVDHFSRMVTVGGKPFFPRGFILEGNATPEAIQYLAENGVTSVSVYTQENYAKMTELLDCAARNNVKVLLQFTFPLDDKDKSVKFIQHFKNHPAVLAWFVFDEVFTFDWGKNNYQTVVDRCNEFKTLDPYHPIVVNDNSYGFSFLKNSKLDFPSEIVSIDHYVWQPAGCFQLVSAYTRLAVEAANKGSRPCWMYLNGAGYAFWTSRDLTPAEQEFETYAAIINGARSIHYLADHPKSKSHWHRVIGLFREIKELTPVLASTLDAPVVKCNSPVIELLVKRTETGVYLIAVNNTTDQVTVRFDVSEAGVRDGEVLFEGRKIKIEPSGMTDKFDGFQRHVYLLK